MAGGVVRCWRSQVSYEELAIPARKDRWPCHVAHSAHLGSSLRMGLQTSIDVESMGRRDGGVGLVQDQQGLQWLRIWSSRVEV